MNQRILDARIVSGRSAVDVNATIASLLGAIPMSCSAGGGGDTTPPTVAITAPAPADTVNGTAVAVTANAADNVGIIDVQFKLDGINLGAADSTFPYAVTWDTTLVANGNHTLTAVARDANSNSTTSAGVTVTVIANTTLTVSPATVVLGGAVTATWGNILNPTALDWVGLFLPGTPNESFLAAEYTDGTANGNLSFPIPPVPLPPGTYELRLLSNDVFILLATSNTFTITLETTPPVVSLTSPAPLATVNGTAVAVTADATDNVGVVDVQFKFDGTNLGAADTTVPYGITWNTTLAANGSHTLTAVARDVAGNTTTSTGVIITVNNAGVLAFLGNPSALSVVGSATPTFLPDPTGLSVTTP